MVVFGDCGPFNCLGEELLLPDFVTSDTVYGFAYVY